MTAPTTIAVDEVMSVGTWATNADLIADCARLGYLRFDWDTIDPTYGYGTFWKSWRPRSLLASDLTPKAKGVHRFDFRHLPFVDRHFPSVVFDPPYKLNGTPSDTDGIDERYGVHGDRYFRWQDRMQLCRDGITECDRVYNGVGYLLVKCQDQVCSGKVRWQTIDFANHAATLGLGLVDRFDFMGGRPQPAGRRQVHARHNASQLLVFKRGWWTSDQPNQWKEAS